MRLVILSALLMTLFSVIPSSAGEKLPAGTRISLASQPELKFELAAEGSSILWISVQGHEITELTVSCNEASASVIGDGNRAEVVLPISRSGVVKVTVHSSGKGRILVTTAYGVGQIVGQGELMSAWIPEISAEPKGPALQFPTGLTASSLDISSVLFAWNAVPHAQGYWLDIALSQEELNSQTGSFRNYNTGLKTSHMWTDLEPGTAYFWRVFAHNEDGGAHGYPSGSVTTMSQFEENTDGPSESARDMLEAMKGAEAEDGPSEAALAMLEAMRQAGVEVVEPLSREINSEPIEHKTKGARRLMIGDNAKGDLGDQEDVQTYRIYVPRDAAFEIVAGGGTDLKLSTKSGTYNKQINGPELEKRIKIDFPAERFYYVSVRGTGKYSIEVKGL
ncbi:MAG: fibronectin type III domain-containing protein [Candidatus Lindowbacteria bacterium]|nr:fibronectin type III domain-containing protein [Candidatus Lindowbacteria bacterium]